MLNYTITIKDETGAQVCRYHVSFDTLEQVFKCANAIIARSRRMLTFELTKEEKGGEQ